MKKNVNVLSLFDGMRCGRIALERLNVNVGKYYSSEVDKYAIKVADTNYPQDIPNKLGDVTKINFKNLEKIDLLIGGSPCQGFSFAGKQKGMVTTENVEITTLEQYLELKKDGFEFEGQSYLFWEFVNALKILKPTYWMLENVAVGKKWLPIINKALGVQPIKINSNKLSAQNRNRYYWTNINNGNIPQPRDKHIMLDDVLETPSDYLSKFYVSERQLSRLDLNGINDGGIGVCFQKPAKKLVKSECLMARDYKGISGKQYYTCVIQDGVLRRLSPIEYERLQTVPDNYTNPVSNTQRYKMLGNGWTVEVIAHIFSFLPDDWFVK